MQAKTIPSHQQTRAPLEDQRVPIRLKLSALWASFMFLYAYVDILAFFKPGTVHGHVKVLAGGQEKSSR